MNPFCGRPKMTTDAPIPCPICANGDANLVLTARQNIPTLQNVALKHLADATGFPTGTLTMMRCKQCEFVWNADFEADKISYDDGYNNDVTYSGYYVAHLEAMADRIINAVPANEPIHYVEIGCGEADFLRLVVERAGGRCVSATGFDPSFTGERNLPDGAVVHKTFFGPDQVGLIPEATNIICSRHTIEHVPDVHGFVSALAAPMTTKARRLFIETPDANWILRQTAFQDFFYEHCSIYTPAAMARILADYGLAAETTPVYDGQYMWTEAQLSADIPPPDVTGGYSLAKDYIEKSTAMLANWDGFIQERVPFGPVAVWGAASKGVTFTLLLAQMQGGQAGIACAIDLNEAKQDCFMPISGTPIVSPKAAQDMGVATVIIMNPNYTDEIKQMATDMGWALEFASLND
jgi:methyltransferase family protein/C-methyltransferase-like protein